LVEKILAAAIWERGDTFDVAEALWRLQGQPFDREALARDCERLLMALRLTLSLDPQAFSTQVTSLALQIANADLLAGELIFLCQKARLMGPAPLWATK